MHLDCPLVSVYVPSEHPGSRWNLPVLLRDRWGMVREDLHHHSTCFLLDKVDLQCADAIIASGDGETNGAAKGAEYSSAGHFLS